MNITLNFIDVECRLEGNRIDWDYIKRLFEEKGLHKKEDLYCRDLEALCYLRKKRFWLNYEFSKLEFQLFSKSNANDHLKTLGCTKEAKEWILDASPVDWDGMLMCYKTSIEHYPVVCALKAAKELYESLL